MRDGLPRRLTAPLRRALVLGGVIDWPVAGAVGLGYLAVRSWL
jgi:hypothetical protein